MKKNVILVLGLVVALLATSCGGKKQHTSLALFADTASYFAQRIADIEANRDESDFEAFMRANDSVDAQKQLANKVLEELFAINTDTLFLPFEQTQNTDKIKILSVWVSGLEFDKVLIEAYVEAIDNSSFMGPHASLAILDKSKNRQEVGGGIQGPNDEKLVVGNVYTFSGSINHLHLLSDFKSLIFSDPITKW